MTTAPDEPPPASRPLRVLVCGSGFGRIWMRALAGDPDVRVVGLVGRGSPRTRRLATAYGVPALTSRDPFPEADVACVAVSASDAEALTGVLLDRGLHVLLEHPVSADVFERLRAQTERAGKCLHVNLHFADLPHVDDFLRSCGDRARRERPRWVLGVCSARTRFSLIDMLLRLFDSPKEAEGAGALDAVATPPRVARSLVGSFDGVPVHVTETAYRSARDDGSDQAVSHRLTIGYPSETVTLVDTWGPVVSTRALRSDAKVTHCLPPDATVSSVRDAALRSAVSALWRQAVDGRGPAAQTPDHLMRVARLWDATGAPPRG